jgi:hypothetical protein
MPKDARLVANILRIWDSGSFLSHFATGHGSENAIYYQKMPKRKIIRPKPRVKPVGQSHYRQKAPGKRPNAASNMTGGKGPDVRDKLAARAARG